MKKMRKIIMIIAIPLAVITIAVIVLYINAAKSISTYTNFDYTTLDLSKVADGSYTGSENGDLVKASVEVTVKDHKITNVKILSHECGLGKPAEVIVKDIVKKNSLEVDAVSSATYSSEVIKMAVYNALKK